VTFMDSIIHAWLFLNGTRDVCVGTEIQKLTIDMKQHILYLQSLDVNEEPSEFQMLLYTCGRKCTSSSSF
jgi:hypothetical protein